MSGPTTAPTVSAARWNPNARPRFSLVVSSAMIASRGGPRTPLPTRSVARATSTIGHAPAIARRSLPNADVPYPPAMNGRRWRKSASRPETAFIADAIPSASPSIRPSTAGGAPSVPVTKNGKTGYRISDAVS